MFLEVPGVRTEELSGDRARAVLAAVSSRDEYKLIDLRRQEVDGKVISESIVVDCTVDAIPSRNPKGLMVRERLELRVFEGREAPKVFPLRTSFPALAHVNHEGPGVPSSLCLYFEPWATIERNWTPRSWLRRITWWLEKTAKDDIHPHHQAVEAMYFNSGFHLVLSPGFGEGDSRPAFTLARVDLRDTLPVTYRPIPGTDAGNGPSRSDPKMLLVNVRTDAIVHGRIARIPNSLGEIESQLLERGVEFSEKLSDALRVAIGTAICKKDDPQRPVLLLEIPITRSAGTPAERIERRAYLLAKTIVAVGQDLGILHDAGNGLSAAPLLGAKEKSNAWRAVGVLPLDVRVSYTLDDARRAAGLSARTSAFRGVLAGVGSLGSMLANIWGKEAWGEWTLVDPDSVEAHNVVRHLARDLQIGLPKVDVVEESVEETFSSGVQRVAAIRKGVTSPEVLSDPLFQSAQLLVDATTQLEVPRDLSRLDKVPRTATTFITPSGLDSVLLLEDDARTIRQDALEAQYYRAIIHAEWGAHHLDGSRGDIYVGAGCRDVSFVLPYAEIVRNAGLVAGQVRRRSCCAAADIVVWSQRDPAGSIVAHEVPVHPVREVTDREWRIVWNTEIERVLAGYRQLHLPSETGGIIVGYVDQILRTVFVVDVLTQPSDSDGSPSGFTRGTSGLDEQLAEIRRRTARLVDYIGEWHSHPGGCGNTPSSLDFRLLSHLAEALAEEGRPALMIIVGEDGPRSVLSFGGGSPSNEGRNR